MENHGFGKRFVLAAGLTLIIVLGLNLHSTAGDPPVELAGEPLNSLRAAGVKLSSFSEQITGSDLMRLTRAGINTLYVEAVPGEDLELLEDLLSEAENKDLKFVLGLAVRPGFTASRSWYIRFFEITATHQNTAPKEGGVRLLNFVSDGPFGGRWERDLLFEWMEQSGIQVPHFFDAPISDWLIFVPRRQLFSILQDGYGPRFAELKARLARETSFFRMTSHSPLSPEKVQTTTDNDLDLQLTAYGFEGGYLVEVENPHPQIVETRITFEEEKNRVTYPRDPEVNLKLLPESIHAFLFNYPITSDIRLISSTGEILGRSRSANGEHLYFSAGSPHRDLTVFELPYRPEIRDIYGTAAVNWQEENNLLFIHHSPGEELDYLILGIDEIEITLFMLPPHRQVPVWPLFGDEPGETGPRLELLIGAEMLWDAEYDQQSGAIDLGWSGTHPLHLILHNLPKVSLADGERFAHRYPQSGLITFKKPQEPFHSHTAQPTVSEDWLLKRGSDALAFTYDDQHWQAIDRWDQAPSHHENFYWLRGRLEIDSTPPRGVRVNTDARYSLFLNGFHLGTSRGQEDFTAAGLFQPENLITILVDAGERPLETLQNLSVELIDHILPDFQLELATGWRRLLEPPDPLWPTVESPDLFHDERFEAFGADRWQVIDLPDYWLGSGAWYTRTLQIDRTRRRYSLQIGTIQGEALIYINEEPIQHLNSDDTPTEIDISQAVKWGKNNIAIFLRSGEGPAAGISPPLNLLGTNSFSKDIEWRLHPLSHQPFASSAGKRFPAGDQITVETGEILRLSAEFENSSDHPDRLLRLNIPELPLRGRVYLNGRWLGALEGAPAEFGLRNLSSDGAHSLLFWLWNDQDQPLTFALPELTLHAGDGLESFRLEISE